MKVFISCPFSGILDDDGTIKREYRAFFDKLVTFFEKRNIDYYLAITRENWGKSYVSPNDSVENDFAGVKSSDILLVIPGNPISGGVHIELGWASALQKEIHIFLEKEKKYSPVLLGLSSITPTEIHYSKKFASEDLLNDMIKTIEEKIKCI